jgi:hypothetical protein
MQTYGVHFYMCWAQLVNFRLSEQKMFELKVADED